MGIDSCTAGDCFVFSVCAERGTHTHTHIHAHTYIHARTYARIHSGGGVECTRSVPTAARTTPRFIVTPLNCRRRRRALCLCTTAATTRAAGERNEHAQHEGALRAATAATGGFLLIFLSVLIVFFFSLSILHESRYIRYYTLSRNNTTTTTTHKTIRIILRTYAACFQIALSYLLLRARARALIAGRNANVDEKKKTENKVKCFTTISSRRYYYRP